MHFRLTALCPQPDGNYPVPKTAPKARLSLCPDGNVPGGGLGVSAFGKLQDIVKITNNKLLNQAIFFNQNIDSANVL